MLRFGSRLRIPKPFVILGFCGHTAAFGSFPGKKKAYTALLQCRTFLCRKKWGPQRKNFGGRYGFPGFYMVFVSTTGLESFSFRPEKLPKKFSFGGGRVRFFLLCFLLADTIFLGLLSPKVQSQHQLRIKTLPSLSKEFLVGPACLPANGTSKGPRVCSGSWQRVRLRGQHP